MRCFSEDLPPKGKDPKETLVMMSYEDGKVLMRALRNSCETLPKKKTVKERKLLALLEEIWCLF